MSYPKREINQILTGAIKQSHVNEWLMGCQSEWRIVPYQPQETTKFNYTCQNEVDRIYWSPQPNSKKWVVGIQNIKDSKVVAYVSFSLFHSTVEGIRDNMLYIHKACTDNQYEGRGLNKMLHWVLIQIVLSMGDIDYISAYVTHKTELYILKSLGGFELLRRERDLAEIEDEIMETHKVRANHILLIDDENVPKWEKVKQEIQNCERPK